MAVYTILISMIILYGIFEKERPLSRRKLTFFQKKKVSINFQNVFLSFVFTIMFVLIAFRGDFSSDYISYERHFNIARNIEWGSLLKDGFKVGGVGGVEFGFYTLMKIVGLFVNDPIYLFITIAFFTLQPVYTAIRNESESRWLSLLLFVVFGAFVTSFNVMRAIFAYSLIFSQRRYLYDRKYVRYLIAIFLISTIHLSSILMVAIVILDVMKFRNQRFILFMIPSSLIALAFSERLILLGDRLLYGNFFSTIYRHGIREASFGNIIAPLLLGLMVVIGTSLIEDSDRDRCYDIWLKTTVLWLFFRIFMIKFIEMRRFADMMSFFMILYFPYMINRLPFNANAKIIIKIILATATVALFYYSMKDSPYNSYYFIWNR